MQERLTQAIELPEAPKLPGLTFRNYRGDKDHRIISEIFLACRAVDGLDWSYSVEDVSNEYKHLKNCDPYQDVLFVEVFGEPIAWIRVWWEAEYSGDYLYRHQAYVLPHWRRRGIGTALLLFAERRLKSTAEDHPEGVARQLQVWSSDTQPGKDVLLLGAGYGQVRFVQEMAQSLDRELPGEAPMPEGLEVRPVEDDHIRAIWEANREAFEDHWGSGPQTEGDYQEWTGRRTFDPSLWKVAWDGDEVVGMVLNFVDKDENREYSRNRGYTEDIAVRRQWRRRGLARSLISQSLQMFSDKGYDEAALAVDTENLSGALLLYERLGFEAFKLYTVFRKPLE